MKLKIRDLKKIIREHGVGGLSTSSSPYRLEKSDRRAPNLDDIISNSLRDYTQQILRAYIAEDQDGSPGANSRIDTNSPIFEAQLDIASQDFFHRLDAEASKKIAQIAREIIENLKGGQYTKSDTPNISDLY